MKLKHLITWVFLSAVLLTALVITGCSSITSDISETSGTSEVGGLVYESTMTLDYAENFSVEYYEGGYALITIIDGQKYLVVPEDKAVPDGLAADIIPLKKPIDKIYLAATSAMALFDSLDELDAIAYTGTAQSGWYIQSAIDALDSGAMVYAGKYSAPDYELLTSGGCGLAVESTMINHTPEVKEKLEALGIPVLIDQSSYEAHPLARTEWIKLYGVLLGLEDKADAVFKTQAASLEALDKTSTDKTVVFFYVSSNHLIITRKSGDYISKMIELAGGINVFADLGDSESAVSTVTISMEQFYSSAKDADIIIYNSTIDTELNTIGDLTAKDALFSDFKAVQNGDVWCTGKNMFQACDKFGDIITELNLIFTGKAGDGLLYFKKLQS